jgi:hypothetical protein
LKTNQETFEHLSATIKTFYPAFKVIAKKDSWVHRFIGGLLKGLGINKTYMTQYWTTLAATTAYPIEDKLGEHYNSWSVLPHEGNHAGQAKRWTSFFFGLFYLLGTPVMAVLGALVALPLFLVAIWTALPWWAGLIALGAGGLLSSPVPFGGWRAGWEFDAYGLSVAVRYWTRGAVTDAYLEHQAKNFTTGAYFFMWPYKGSTMKKLRVYRTMAEQGKFFEHKRYGKYYRAMYLSLKECGRTKV